MISTHPHKKNSIISWFSVFVNGTAVHIVSWAKIRSHFLFFSQDVSNLYQLNIINLSESISLP